VTGAVLGLVASYAVLGVLLLSLNLRSAWHWVIKATAIVLTCGFFVAAFLAIEALLGWPTEAPPPAHFQLHAALVLEPDRGRAGGAIYLWLSPRAADGDVAGAPRTHALPYSRALHEQTERALRSRRRDSRSRARPDPAASRATIPHRSSCSRDHARSCRPRPASHPWSPA
jgi:hypothetical protein